MQPVDGGIYPEFMLNIFSGYIDEQKVGGIHGSCVFALARPCISVTRSVTSSIDVASLNQINREESDSLY